MAYLTIRDDMGMVIRELDLGGHQVREIILTINTEDEDQTLDLSIDLDMGRVGIYSNPDPETGECQDEVEVIQFPALSDYMREY
jgi:hypothetical protein